MTTDIPHPNQPRANQPAPGTKLVRFDDLEETDAKGFTFGEGKELFRCFVVRWMGGVFGYINECPHIRSPLDWAINSTDLARIVRLRRPRKSIFKSPARSTSPIAHCVMTSVLPFTS